jgi:Domain of unknown function (DUF1929)/Kelch motif
MEWNVLSQNTEVLAVHAALLHTGKILYFSGDEHDETQHDTGRIDHTRLFDCNTLAIQKIGSPTTDVFCSGHAMLPDGRLLVAGGTEDWPGGGGQHDVHFPGLRECWIFNPLTNTWRQAASMNFQPGHLGIGGGRWYPTLVTLADGRVLAMSGHPSATDTRPSHNNDSPEIFSLSPNPDGSWFQFPDDPAHQLSLYPRLHLLPSGHVFSASPVAGRRTQRFDPVSGNWEDLSAGPPDDIYDSFGGTSVLLPLMPDDDYRPRILLCGSRQPRIMDLSDASPAWQPTNTRTLSGMPRRNNLNAVLLPTGEVLVLGGASTRSDASAVLAAELYQPATDNWVTLEPATVVRNYHSVALLMPDGRVWTAGSNFDCKPGVANRELRIELYEPWYYNRPRPQIVAVSPTVVTSGETFSIDSLQAATINQVVAIRTGSVTHSFDSDQRYVGLRFQYIGDIQPGVGRLNVVAPPSGGIAPPGWYLIFIINQDGVPSVGTFLQVMRPDPAMNWTKIGGPTQTLAAFGSTLCGLSSGGVAVYKYNGTPENWSQIGGPAVELIGGGSNLYAISPSDFSIWQYMGSGDQWQRIGGPGFMFVSVGNTVYGLNPDRSAVYQFVSLV